jgi:amino acid transporter
MASNSSEKAGYELQSISGENVEANQTYVTYPMTVNDQFVNSSHGLIVSEQNPKAETSSSQSLKRSLTFTDGLGIIVGIIIGSGIFSSPGVALSRAGSSGAMILAWIVSGILVFLASQCYMELAGMFPSAGGDYEYLSQAYGEYMAFSFAWFYFFISKTGSCAIIALVFARYIEYVLDLTHHSSNSSMSNIHNGGEETFTSKAIAIAVVIIISAINCQEVSESAFVQKVMTSLKLLLVLMLFLLALLYLVIPSSIESSSDTNTGGSKSSSLFAGTANIASFSSSLIACLWCFDGWADLNFMQEELIRPEVDFVRTMLSGIAIVTVAYVLANIAYLSVLPNSDIIASNAIAIDVGHQIDASWKSGNFFATIFALGVAFSAAGSLNGTIMTGGRIFYAVARAGSAPSFFAKLNTAGAPYMALISQCFWSIVLLLLPGSSFSVLLDYYGCMSWLYYALVSFAVVILRNRQPLKHRPYRAWLYPLPPIIVVVLASAIIISSLVTEPIYTIFAISSVLISFPVYFLLHRHRSYSLQTA